MKENLDSSGLETGWQKEKKIFFAIAINFKICKIFSSLSECRNRQKE
jgi:hypothetical protein